MHNSAAQIRTRPPSLPPGYADPRVIRGRSSFEVIAARRLQDGQSCVLILPGVQADWRAAKSAMAEMAACHTLIDHPGVVKLRALGESAGMPYLDLDSAAVRDGLDVTCLIADSARKLPYQAADGFIVSLRLALCAAHAVPHPVTGLPIALGRISGQNILFARDGRWQLFGFGRNIAIEKSDGSLDAAVPFYQAPELASGAPATTAGDYVALILYMRSLLSFLDMTGILARLFNNDIQASDKELIDCMQWVERRVLGAFPPFRASMAEAVAVADRIRVLLGVRYDTAAFAELARGLIRTAEEDAADAIAMPLGPLVVGPLAAWVAVAHDPGQRLGPASRRILLALIDRHAQQGPPLTMWELLEIGWPGEKPLPIAGANRVYVALTRMRRMGLREVLQRFDDGYQLVPGTVVQFSADVAPPDDPLSSR